MNDFPDATPDRKASKVLAKKRKKSPPVLIQIGVEVARKRGRRIQLPADVLADICDRWLDGDGVPTGARIVPVIYKRHNGTGRTLTDEAEIEEVRATMLANFRRGGLTFRAFRQGQKIRLTQPYPVRLRHRKGRNTRE